MSQAASDSVIQSIPLIYLGSHDQPKLDGFNSVVVELDAKLDSGLNWNKEKQKALEYISKGYKVVWNLNFGLFHELPLPLSDTSQYRSLNIAIDHFFDFILKDTADHTLGVIIYKGSIDFSHEWPWDVDQELNFRGWLSEQFKDHHAFCNHAKLPCESLYSIDPKLLYENEFGRSVLQYYCLRAALDYFSILTSRFETDLLPYVLLDTSKIQSPMYTYQLLEHEDFEFIQLALKNSPFESSHALGWDSHAYANGYIGKSAKKYIEPKMHPTVGVVIPTHPVFDPEKRKRIDQTIERVEAKTSVKYIGERVITLDWAGIEHLIVFEVEPESKRKLEGFAAAGGTLVKVGNPLNMTQEIPFQEFIKSLEG